MEYRPEELLICVIARLLDGIENIAVGVSSPIPAAAALLQNELTGGETGVTILNSKSLQSLNDGASELFDRAAQGRVGAFFLSGGQIDGHGNINLMGIGPNPRQQVRWSGSFGSAMLYYLVPRIILFRIEHTRRTLVDSVDFITAPGTSGPEVFRPGGPTALVTNLCLFSFDRQKARFRLESIHPGHSLEEIRDNTGFDFELPENVPQTPEPELDHLKLLRGPVAARLADPYPQFAQAVFEP